MHKLIWFIVIFTLSYIASATPLLVHVSNVPATNCMVSIVVDDNSGQPPLVLTRQMSPSDMSLTQQFDLASGGSYRVRAAVMLPDLRIWRIVSVAASEVRINPRGSSLDLAPAPVMFGLSHVSSGTNDVYTVTLDDAAGFFAGDVTGVVSASFRISSGEAGGKRYFSHFARYSTGAPMTGVFTIPAGMDGATYRLMLYVPALSDSTHMAIVDSPAPLVPGVSGRFSAAASSGGTSANGIAQPTTVKAPATNAVTTQENWTVRVGAGKRLVRVRLSDKEPAK